MAMCYAWVVSFIVLVDGTIRQKGKTRQERVMVGKEGNETRQTDYQIRLTRWFPRVGSATLN